VFSSAGSSNSNNNKNDAEVDEKPSSMSYDEADVSLKNEDEKKRLDNQGFGLTDEEKDLFVGKEEQYDAMRALVRKSAQELGVEKSVATQQAIKEATLRAMNKELNPELDTTAFMSAPLNEDEMSEDEKKLIDDMRNTPIFEMAKEEFSKVRLPNFGATVRLGVFMAVLFVITSTGIWNLEAFIRARYGEWGLIPSKPADFSEFYTRQPISFTDEQYMNKFNELPWWKAPEWYEGKTGKKPYLGSSTEKWGTYDPKQVDMQKTTSIVTMDIPQDI